MPWESNNTFLYFIFTPMVSDVEVIYEAPIRTRTPDTTRTWTRTRTRGHL